MSRYVYTCQRCGGADLQFTAWVYANKPGIVDGEPPTEQCWCSTCQAEVDFFTDEVDEIDPDAWASNGYRCGEPKCVSREGCETCQLYVCPACNEVRVWSDGGAPDPRCEACFNADPIEHVAIMVPRVDLLDLLDALRVHAEPTAEERAAEVQRVAYRTRESLAGQEILEFFPRHVESLYAMARSRVDAWLRIGKLINQVRGAIVAPEGTKR